MDQHKIEKNIGDQIKIIQSLIKDNEWLQLELKKIDDFEQNNDFLKTMPLETKIILQQTKIYIIEMFWEYLNNKIKIDDTKLLYYLKGEHISPIDINLFKTPEGIKFLLNNFPINYNTTELEHRFDIILELANYYWLDLIRKEVIQFEQKYISEISNNSTLFLMKNLYTKLESYYLVESERESWVGNLEQEFAPLYRIYFRGIQYNKALLTRESVSEFIDSLYKTLRNEAANNVNNFIFSDSDFTNFSNNCPIHIKEDRITNIKSHQINSRYNSTILGCPAVFSKVNIKYKYGQLLKDLYYWQMNLYKEILLIC